MVLDETDTCISKPDLLLFKAIAGTGDLLSNHALGIYIL